MNKPQVKKVLIRNSSQRVPKTRFMDEKDEIKEKPETIDKPFSPKTRHSTENFQTPELQSIMKIAKQIDFVEKAKFSQTKIPPNPPTFDLNLTKKVNFPLDRAIYKNLISLNVPAQQTQRSNLAREPLPSKDLEPDLLDFTSAKPGKEYRYKSSLKHEQSLNGPNVNNLRLYKILQIHNE